eukprot:9490497-Pyramimonas_sp.AAC.1
MARSVETHLEKVKNGDIALNEAMLFPHNPLMKRVVDVHDSGAQETHTGSKDSYDKASLADSFGEITLRSPSDSQLCSSTSDTHRGPTGTPDEEQTWPASHRLATGTLGPIWKVFPLQEHAFRWGDSQGPAIAKDMLKYFSFEDPRTGRRKFL